MIVRQTVPGEHTLGYAILNTRGFFVADDNDSSGLVLWRGISDAKLFPSRTAAYRAILHRWCSTYRVVKPEVRRVVRCTVCDGSGHGCSRCGATGREMRD